MSEYLEKLKKYSRNPKLVYSEPLWFVAINHIEQLELKIKELKLKRYIQEHHGGNVTAYAKEYGTSRQQMDKWLALDCRVIDGIIYRPVARHKK